MTSSHPHHCKRLTTVLMLSVGLQIATAMSSSLSAAESDGPDCTIEPFQVVKVGAAVAGLVSSVLIDRGDTVKKGQLLAEIESGVERANVALARAHAQNDSQLLSARLKGDFLQRKSDRSKKLSSKEGIVSKASTNEANTEAMIGKLATDDAESALEIARLELARAEALLKERQIVSPIDGVVLQRTTSAGEYLLKAGAIIPH